VLACIVAYKLHQLLQRELNGHLARFERQLP
jgi:hypothetical protein